MIFRMGQRSFANITEFQDYLLHAVDYARRLRERRIVRVGVREGGSGKLHA